MLHLFPSYRDGVVEGPGAASLQPHSGKSCSSQTARLNSDLPLPPWDGTLAPIGT
jgi:hypothetical protein